MKQCVATLMMAILCSSTAFAGLGSTKAAYQGGTAKETDFPGTDKAVEGFLDTSDEMELKFEYAVKIGDKREKRVYAIPYS